MKSPLAKEAIYTALMYYQALQRLGNYRALAEFYREMAHSFLTQLECRGEETGSRANLGYGDKQFAEQEVNCEVKISAHEATARLRSIKPLAEHNLPEDELARLLRALREDGFQWQPPRAV